MTRAPCTCGPHGICDTACPKRAVPKKRGAPEAAIQRAIRKRLMFHGIVFVHVKNEGARSMFGHVAAKADGMLPGFVDGIALQSPGRVAFLEVKPEGWTPPSDSAKGQKAQHWRRQRDIHEMLRRMGFHCEVVTSQDEAVEALRAAGFRL